MYEFLEFFSSFQKRNSMLGHSWNYS